MLLDLKRQQWLVPVLLRLRARRASLDLPLWNTEYHQIFVRFNRARHAVGAASLGYTPYCLRHGDASHVRR